MAAFNLPSIAKLTMTDELHLQELGERKIALFCCIPDSDKSLNYLVGMIYTQLIQTLYSQADRVHKGRLPVPVHCLMDEYANIYLTVSVVKRNADEARSYFARVGTDLVTHLAQLSSVAQELTLTERLHIFRDFFKAGEQAAAEFNIHEHAKRGQHFKDWFCPDSMEFAADHFKLDARYGRVLYLQDYASYIKDSFVSEL